jgi:hypothetical protein
MWVGCQADVAWQTMLPMNWDAGPTTKYIVQIFIFFALRGWPPPGGTLPIFFSLWFS